MPGQEMYLEGDLIWFIDGNKVTLFRTIETHMDPSQEVLDEICDSDTPYHWTPETKLVRVMQEMGVAYGNWLDVREELLSYID
jgi:hypothetical protein